ncbi:MAG TPA: isoprenylcysteine carboxylmethyltransferase family protein [Spirochaetota bacterium]|nr:isoprenylcysteine carboxylmethyltransferase family protein [Spirochaetota bacterium]HOD15766.1 isoprenylcysteine carboxylmethyltransferase family protein [Spirochaetota bacterium]HPG52570.1 isoprenylcysteine carboxylmethyltransferase family protein [Spirochaetota bacterium]HQL80585.1 isoprenylcysteine carboxylmethyltransferase family protein [Spirochaetota bacterium]
MKRFGMAVSPLSIVACGIAFSRDCGPALIALLALNGLWLVLETGIALKQEFLDEVPRSPWIMASRVLWLCSVFFLFADVRWGLVPFSVPLWVSVAALALTGLGVALRAAAFAGLGRYFTYDVRLGKGQKLVTSGVYSVIRHPAYLAICLLGSLPGLAAGSAAGFALMTLFTVPQTLYRLSLEENMLAARFGAEFGRYREKTWRLVPFLY